MFKLTIKSPYSLCEQIRPEIDYKEQSSASNNIVYKWDLVFIIIQSIYVSLKKIIIHKII